MNFKDLKKNWDTFGRTDPYWAILTDSDKKNNQWNVDAFFKTGEQQIALVMNQIKSLGLAIPKRKALDFGCGAGRLTQALAIYFDEVHGVDVAPSMIELARSHNRRGERCIFHVNDHTDLNLFADDTFDFIYSVITLQHMRPHYSKKYIKEFVRILAPYGLLIFQVPSIPENFPITPLNKFKLQVIKLLPSRIWNLYLSLRYGDAPVDEPRMEMYGIEKQDVVKILKRAGAKTIDIIIDKTATGWLGFTYITTKKK